MPLSIPFTARTPRSRTALALGLALSAALAGAPALAAIPAAERTALLALYNSAGGANWSNTTSNTNPWTGASGTECSWHGVTCTGPAGSERVTALRLNFNNLTGTVSSSLGNLSELTTLNLFQNALTGPIPPLAGMTKLVTVSLGQNQLSGSIPPLTGLTQLESFEVRGSNLTGSTPALTGLTRLKVFHVGGNDLDGTIGPVAGATALETFNINGNKLTGPIPDLTSLAALQLFDAGNNRLTSITALASLANLDSFLAPSNQLSGPIPSLTGLGKLRSFHVEYNQLSGPIPSLSGLASIENFYVRDNQLTGQIPPSLATLSTLRFFQVQNNRLVGSPPMPPNNTISAIMCPNPLRNSADAAINAAWDPRVGNGNNPWATGCTGSWDVTPTVRDAFSGEIITDGHTGTISPSSVQILPAGGGTQFTLTPAPGYRLRNQIDANCPGSLNGNTYTVAGITANCYINASFVPDVAPGNGACGSDHGKILAIAPTNLCSAGNASAVTGTGPWNWSCAGTGGGTTAQCTAQKAAQTWVVTAAVNGPGGSAAPTTQTVVGGSRATVTATPAPSYMLTEASGCGATFSGNTVTTAAVTADCTVTLRFALATTTTTRFISLTPPAPRVGEEVAVRVAVDVGDTPLSSGIVNVSGGGASCVATTDTTGQGQCSLRFPTAGTHQLTAAYPGDPAQLYLPSSAVQDITVAASPTAMHVVPTLGQWTLALLAALTGLLSALRLRRA
ncbi:IPTL-CTERM sorting domain-containing protein [Ottowia thiooxydans]|uniref:IPTL-CTERM sorting domain-containing protein n=1 Tax=Ottowia thiooxydans TaxID=219182 RepID=UPI0004094C1B|nr:IPTL-CTERM sorting domain-containing protein [Ottowia thiooxydans]